MDNNDTKNLNSNEFIFWLIEYSIWKNNWWITLEAMNAVWSLETILRERRLLVKTHWYERTEQSRDKSQYYAERYKIRDRYKNTY